MSLYPVIPTLLLELGSNLNPEDIEEGDDVYFECKVHANPAAYKVIWKHNVSIKHFYRQTNTHTHTFRPTPRMHLQNIYWIPHALGSIPTVKYVFCLGEAPSREGKLISVPLGSRIVVWKLVYWYRGAVHCWKYIYICKTLITARNFTRKPARCRPTFWKRFAHDFPWRKPKLAGLVQPTIVH